MQIFQQPALNFIHLLFEIPTQQQVSRFEFLRRPPRTKVIERRHPLVILRVNVDADLTQPNNEVEEDVPAGEM